MNSLVQSLSHLLRLYFAPMVGVVLACRHLVRAPTGLTRASFRGASCRGYVYWRRVVRQFNAIDSEDHP